MQKTGTSWSIYHTLRILQLSVTCISMVSRYLTVTGHMLAHANIAIINYNSQKKIMPISLLQIEPCQGSRLWHVLHVRPYHGSRLCNSIYAALHHMSRHFHSLYAKSWCRQLCHILHVRPSYGSRRCHMLDHVNSQHFSISYMLDHVMDQEHVISCMSYHVMLSMTYILYCTRLCQIFRKKVW